MNANTKKWVSLSVIVGGALLGTGWAYVRWRRSQIFVETDDAYVKGHIVTVAPRIAAPLLSVDVAENESVRAGQVIATLDPKDYDAALARADASLAEASSALALNQAQIAQARAQLKASESQKDLAELEKQRQSALFERNSIPKQKYDQAMTAEQVAAAQVEASRKQVAAAQGALAVSRGKVSVAQAAFAQARLNRSYCTITAPVAGVVSRKMAEPGVVVATGQPLLAVVPLGQEEIWVEANFKETQLKNVQPGQKVKLKADVDDRVFTGRVESLAAGTGPVFSLLPAENATGNWVKVVQRVPVKIALDPATSINRRLCLGMSVDVEIDTQRR